MSAQGGFALNNRFAGLATDVDSDDDTTETIVGTINSHKRQQQSTSIQRRQMHLSSSSLRTQRNYINNSKP
jgi:hypothetical protein